MKSQNKPNNYGAAEATFSDSSVIVVNNQIDETKPLVTSPVDDSTQDLSGPQAKSKRSLWSRFKALKWWQKALLFLASFIVITVIIWYAILIPVITREAQKQIDASLMTFKTLLITNPTADTCELKSTNIISNAQVRPGRMYGTTFDAIFQGNTFASLYTNDMDVEEAGKEFPMDSVLHVHDQAVFQDFMRAAIMNDSIALSVKGTMKLGVKWRNRVWFSIKVNMNKSSPMKGCGGLKNGQVISFTPEITSSGMAAHVAIQLNNPSIVNIYPLGGFMKLNLLYKGMKIGSGISKGDAKISSGLNTIVANGTLNMDSQTLPYIIDMVERYMAGENSSMFAEFGADATGVNLYNPALDGIMLETNFPGMKWVGVDLSEQLAYLKQTLNSL
jgi:hypothetical protein